MLGTRFHLPPISPPAFAVMISGRQLVIRRPELRRLPALLCQPRMGCLISFLCCFVFASLSFAQNDQGSGPTIRRIVEFRDGTVILVDIPRGQLPWKSVTRDGRITELPTPMDSVQRIDLVLSPVTEQVEIVRNLISALGSANYQQRQEAHRRLVEIGAQYRPVILASEETEEPEVRWRIQDILENVAGSDTAQRNDFDRLTLADGTVLDGDVGDWQLEVSYRGAPITLNRDLVLSIYQGDLELDYDGDSGVAQIERIPQDDPTHFPVNLTRLDFEQTPAGEPLSVGEDVANAYVDAGVTISTSIPDTMVSVQSYKVRNGQSAATHSPPYTGTITFRFCVPGNPRLPASVRSIGCWVSYISPSGTYLQAFDARDRLIGEVSTTVSGAEFLALKSTVPIAYCKLHPDNSVDPDFAFDEFVFDAPRPLLESGDPDLNSVVLYTGERLQSRGLAFNNDRVELKDLTVGIANVSIPAAEIAVIIPRVNGTEDGTSTNKFDSLPHVLMKNGSLVFVDPDPSRGLRLVRSEQGQVQIADIASLWGANTAPTAADPESLGELLEQGPVVILEDDRVSVADAALGANWITGSALAERDLHFAYEDSPLIWFHLPEPVTQEHGVVRTTAGESFVFGANAFNLAEWTGDKVKLVWHDTTLEIPFDDIRSIRFPLAK